MTTTGPNGINFSTLFNTDEEPRRPEPGPVKTQETQRRRYVRPAPGPFTGLVISTFKLDLDEVRVLLVDALEDFIDARKNTALYVAKKCHWMEASEQETQVKRVKERMVIASKLAEMLKRGQFRKTRR